MSGQAFKRVRTSIGLDRCRKPLPAWAWPGGYPMYYFFADGGCCCADCANMYIVEIDQERTNSHGGWALGGFDVNYEDPDLICDNCGNEIPSACGEDRPKVPQWVDTQPRLFSELP